MARQVLSLLLALCLACGPSRHLSRSASASEDSGIGPETRVYDAFVYAPEESSPPPPAMSDAEFRHSVQVLAQGVPRSPYPAAFARALVGSPGTVEFLGLLSSGSNAQPSPPPEENARQQAQVKKTQDYLKWCATSEGGGDCIGLLEDGPLLSGEDEYTLALSFAFSGTLQEMMLSLKDMVHPRTLMTMVLWTASLYLLALTLPEPVSKSLAAVLTAGLLVMAGWEAVTDLVGGFFVLMRDVDRATTFAEVRTAGERYSQKLGKQLAQALVAVILAVLGGSASEAGQKLNQVPAFRRAAAQSEAAGGVGASRLAEVEQAVLSSEGEFVLLARYQKPPASTGGASGPKKGPQGNPQQPTATTVIRHRGGNQQVEYNGQRWHLSPNKQVSDISPKDEVGDAMEAAAREIAKTWGPATRPKEVAANIDRALSQGKTQLALKWEGQAKGRYVERKLRDQFKQLEWSHRGVDAVDPMTGIKYEVCSGTYDNMARHGRRMSNEVFRLITF